MSTQNHAAAGMCTGVHQYTARMSIEEHDRINSQADSTNALDDLKLPATLRHHESDPTSTLRSPFLPLPTDRENSTTEAITRERENEELKLAIETPIPGTPSVERKNSFISDDHDTCSSPRLEEDETDFNFTPLADSDNNNELSNELSEIESEKESEQHTEGASTIANNNNNNDDNDSNGQLPSSHAHFHFQHRGSGAEIYTNPAANGHGKASDESYHAGTRTDDQITRVNIQEDSVPQSTETKFSTIEETDPTFHHKTAAHLRLPTVQAYTRTPHSFQTINPPPAHRIDNDASKFARVSSQLRKAEEEIINQQRAMADLRENLTATHLQRSSQAFSRMVDKLRQEKLATLNLKLQVEKRARDLDRRELRIGQLEEYLAEGQRQLEDLRTERGIRPLSSIEWERMEREAGLRAKQLIEDAEERLVRRADELRINESALYVRELQYKEALRIEVEEIFKDQIEKQSVECKVCTDRVKKEEQATKRQADKQMPTDTVPPRYVTFAAQLRGPSEMHNGQLVLANSRRYIKPPSPPPQSLAPTSAAISTSSSTQPITPSPALHHSSHPSFLRKSIHSSLPNPNPTTTAPTNPPIPTSHAPQHTNNYHYHPAFLQGYAACRRAHALLADLQAKRIQPDDKRLAFLLDPNHPENLFSMGVKVGELDGKTNPREMQGGDDNGNGKEGQKAQVEEVQDLIIFD